jgi:hypothetical protein
VANLFIGSDVDGTYRPGSEGHRLARFGTRGYDGFPAGFADYLARVEEVEGDHARFHGQRQPAYIRDNAYAVDAESCEHEQGATVLHEWFGIDVVDQGDEVHLQIDASEELLEVVVPAVTASDLPRVRIADADFEEPDGSPVDLGTDLTGARKEPGRSYPVGPLATLPPPGRTLIRVW